MNVFELAADVLAAQECESLAACVARGQAPDTYQDIVAKVRGHTDMLPVERRTFWTDQCKALGVVLYPPKKVAPKPGGISVP